jgi:hypothetical protein
MNNKYKNKKINKKYKIIDLHRTIKYMLIPPPIKRALP